MGGKASKGAVQMTQKGQTMDQDGTIAATLAAVGPVKNFSVVQRFFLSEAVTCGCYQKNNIYHIFNKDADQKILEVHEKSKFCDRICCHPYHSYTLSFYPVIEGKLVDGPAAYTIERPGCGYQCCPPRCGDKCLGCCVCCDWCRQEHFLHRGNVEATDEMRVGQFPKDNVIETVTAPACGGYFTPTLEMKSTDGTVEGRVEGPFMFGGLLELCCTFDYPISKAGSPPKTGDMAKVQRLKPDSAVGAMKQFVGQGNVFSLEVTDPSMAGQEGGGDNKAAESKIKLLTAMFAAEYLLYEFDQAMCGVNDEGKAYCTLCLCFCCGCVIQERCVLNNGN